MKYPCVPIIPHIIAMSVSVMGASVAWAAELPSAVLAQFGTAGCQNMAITTTHTVALTPEQMTNAGLNAAMQNDTTVLLPAGTYNVSTVIYISGRSHVIVRGAVDADGKPATTLRFTKSLTNLFGNDPNGFGYWHGEGGLITVGATVVGYKPNNRTASNAIGIENLHVTFNRTAYNNRHEDGYNAFYFSTVKDSYISNVSITNCDTGILTYRASHCTITNIQLDAQLSGHFGVAVAWGGYNRIENIRSISGIVHDIAVQNTTYNIFKNIATVTGAHDGISFRGGSTHNLFSDIAVGGTTTPKSQVSYTPDTITFGASNGLSRKDPASFGLNYYNNVFYLDTLVTMPPSYLRNVIFVYYSSSATVPTGFPPVPSSIGMRNHNHLMGSWSVAMPWVE